MHKILVSWYGITDLRASLGLLSRGPVLGALLADAYDELHVLQYLDKAKEPWSGPVAAAAACNGEAESMAYISRLCNTEAANTHFIIWLNEQARGSGLSTRITAHTAKLHHLNDSDGIYGAAVSVLDQLSRRSDTELSLDISPGTPLMALLWAFASLRYPNVNLRLLASSRGDYPPEVVNLPAELFHWHARQLPRKLGTERQRRDVVYHLFGDQRMPSLLGIREFPAKRHIFVSSHRYPADVMSQFVGDAEYEELVTDAYNASTFLNDVGEHLSHLPDDASIAMNLTGGTKIMYACALELARKYNALPFYFDIANNKVVHLLNFSSRGIAATFDIPTLIHLNSKTQLEDCRASGLAAISSKQSSLSCRLNSVYPSLRRLYSALEKYQDLSDTPFSLSEGGLSVELLPDGKAKVNYQRSGASFRYEFTQFPDFAKYLCGGWFEQYVYDQIIRKLVDEGIISEARLNLVLSAKGSTDEYQELDVVFTEGRRLYVIECKSGRVQGVHLEKLSSVVRMYGGTGARGILCYRNARNKPLTNRNIIDKAKAMGIVLCEISSLESSIRTLLKA